MIFILLFSFVAVTLLIFAIFKLPGEKWQMMAAVPWKKEGDKWVGIPITYYGFFSALAYSSAVFVYMILAFSAGADYFVSFAVAVPVLFLSMLASRIIAIIVEGKSYTFTIGGASFFGFFFAPLWIFSLNILFDMNISILLFMAIILISYTFGESIGRLSCISFGCCYGRPADERDGLAWKLSKKLNHRYIGCTKKACYEGGYEGVNLFPVQGITSIIFMLTGCVSLYFFLAGNFVVSFIISLVVTQGWRVVSEFLRDDFRGNHESFSTYQIMALVTIFSGEIFAVFYPYVDIYPDVIRGFSMVWDVGILIFVELIFIASFIYTGKSEVTGAEIKFFVREDRI